MLSANVSFIRASKGASAMGADLPSRQSYWTSFQILLIPRYHLAGFRGSRILLVVHGEGLEVGSSGTFDSLLMWLHMMGLETGQLMLATKSIQLRFLAERRRHLALARAFLKRMRSLSSFVDWKVVRACFLDLMRSNLNNCSYSTLN